MAAYLSPVPKLQFIDANGNPVVGGKLYTYAAGTTTPLATYTNNVGNVANPNPIILDSAGMANVWLGAAPYKMKLTTSTDVELWTVDYVQGNDALLQLAASGGSALVGFLQSGTGAQARTVQSKLRDVISVADFIPAGTNTAVTDCQPYIKAAIAEAVARGGSTIVFPAGTYNLVTTESDGTISAHFTLSNADGIDFIGYGAVLSSAYSSASTAAVMFNLNGCRRVTFDGFDIVGTFARVLNVVSNYSIGGFYIRSTTRDSESIILRNMRLQSVYYAASAFANPTDVYRARTILVENVFGFNGFYGILFANNGDNVTAINFRTARFVRSYFCFGVSNHNVNYTSIDGDVFTDCLIKAYERDTIDIVVNALIIGNTSNDSHVTVESQHNPATQPVPARLKNIVLNINDLQASGTGPSLRFAYFQDTPTPVETATSSNNLFDNVSARGNVRSYVQFAVAQPADSGAINLQGLVYDTANSGNPYAKGFYEPIARYVQGNSNFAFKAGPSTLPVGLFGGVYFYQYDGTQVGYFDGTNGTTAFQFLQMPNYPYRFAYVPGYSAGTKVFELPGNDTISYGIKVFEGANTSAPNAANAVMKIGTMTTTNRSVNATGTLNASGADYAEYEWNNGLTIAKGSVVGFKADGTLTLTFADAVRFGVKSTNPSFVGGDTWGNDDVLGPRPERPFRKPDKTDPANPEVVLELGETDEDYAARLDAYEAALADYEAKLEAERIKVDRVAYSGKTPVNVWGAAPGGYIIAADDNGAIAGQFVADPTFDQYKRAVGRVNRILDDGRAEIAVIVH